MKDFRHHLKTTVLALAMVACMVASVLTGFGTVEAKADQPVEYAFYNKATGKFETLSCDSYVAVSTEAHGNDLTMSDGWYVLDGQVRIDTRITVSGTANIILKDDCTFVARYGINVASGSALNIYGQGTLVNGENATDGILSANFSSSDYNSAGIGGGNGETGGDITINGGTVVVKGSYEGAGIGGGKGGAGGNITINGGLVTVNTDRSGIAAGIGGGSEGNGGNITINGGNISVSGSDYGAGIGGGYKGAGGIITINGGTVNATGGSHGGAGIGGGHSGVDSTSGSGGNITINGGEITTTGVNGGAGIGGGYNGSGGSITINGGVLNAEGSISGAGIGGGYGGAGGNITINGGIIEATGGNDAAGIGGGDHNGSGGTIEITAGMIKATGKSDGAGIGGGKGGAGGNVTITGGMIEATGGNHNGTPSGAGIGGGYGASSNGSYDLGGDITWFASASENFGYTATTGAGTNMSYAIVYKVNSGILTASDSTITAKYISTSGNKQSVNLAVEAPADNAIIFGDDSSAQAKLNGCDDFNSALGRTGNSPVSASQIEYYNENGERLTGGAPTAIGSYTARITVDGVTASADYSITKADPVITAPMATSYTYTGDDKELITGGSTSGGTLKYSLSENGTFSQDIPKGKNAGSYTVYYMVEGNSTVKSSKAFSVPAGIGKGTLSLSLTQRGWKKGETAPTPVLSGNASGGAVAYTYKRQNADDSTYSDSVPTEVGNYVVKATVAETANYLGATATAEFAISESDSSQSNTNPDPAPAPVTPVYNTEPAAENVKEVPKPSVFTRENKDGSVTKIEIVWNEDGTTTVINQVKQADGTVERKEETRDSKGNGTLKIEKKDALGNLLSSTEGTIKVNKKGTETIKSTTVNSDGSKEEKTQKTYKRDPAADNVKKVTINVKKTDAAGNTEVVKTTAFVGVLGDATVTEKSEVTFAAGNNGAENGAAGGAGNSGKGEEGSDGKNKSDKDKADENSTTKVVKEERQYSLSVNGRLKLLSLTSDGEKVTIPESIELDGMKRVVKSIGKNALKGNKTVKSVEIGENITTICSGAFKNCKNLELVELTGSIKTIYKNAFKGIAKNAKFVIKASEEDFARIIELIKKSGVDERVTFERAE